MKTSKLHHAPFAEVDFSALGISSTTPADALRNREQIEAAYALHRTPQA